MYLTDNVQVSHAQFTVGLSQFVKDRKATSDEKKKNKTMQDGSVRKEEGEEEEEENADYLEHHICTFWYKRVNNFAFLTSMYRISTALKELRMRRPQIYSSCAHEYIQLSGYEN